MNAERLLAHFERISEAPDSIARLRRFILDLAVRGKLVEQDPEDEPVSLLLDEIKSRMTRLRLNHAFSVVDQSEIPFDEPSGWTWCRLGEVCEKTGSGSTPRGGKDVYKNSGVPFLRSQNIYDDGLRLEDVAFIDDLTHERMAGTRVLPCDLLLNITGGSIGRCAKVPLDFGEANISQHVAIIRVAPRGMEEFLHSLILSPYFQEFVDKSQTGAGRGGLPKNRMDAIPIPLPPLAEQHRIVAKVDELMSLCDLLEEAKKEREQCRDSLVAASLQVLNKPADEGDAFRDHARFTFNNLPRITTRAAHIKQLRQTILNLAVLGKLVAQDPSEEPASELLKRISAEKARLVKSGRIKRSTPALAIAEQQSLFELPQGWVSVLWNSIALKIGDIDHKMPESVVDGIPYISPRDFLPNNQIDFERAKRVSRQDFTRLSTKIKPDLGDIIYPRYGTIGKNRLVQEQRDFLASYSCCVIKVLNGFINPWYQYFFSISSHCRLQAKAAENKTTQSNVGIRSIQEFIVPLPPLPEQHRIVAKVDELMSVCDQLEAQITVTEQDSRRFLESVLADALAPGMDLSAEAKVA